MPLIPDVPGPVGDWIAVHIPRPGGLDDEAGFLSVLPGETLRQWRPVEFRRQVQLRS